jgi:hypothetical protein
MEMIGDGEKVRIRKELIMVSSRCYGGVSLETFKENHEGL